MVGKKLLRSLYHISYIIQVKYCRTRTPSPGLSQPIIQVCNGNKLNFSNLQKLFNLACFLALPECLKIVICSVSVEFSTGNDQQNSLSVVIAGIQPGLFNALATKPTIDEKCGIVIWGINIPRSTPFEDLIVREFVTANKISHLNRLVLSACSIRSHSIANLSVVVRIWEDGWWWLGSGAEASKWFIPLISINLWIAYTPSR